MNPAEKKVLLFLVEGSTDSTSLGLVLSRLTESADVRFFVLGGDICYRYRITPENAAKTIMRSVNGFLQRYRLRKGDILKIVHVIDTDGAFIPPTRVFHGGNDHAYYGKDKIVTLSDESMRARNEHKTAAAMALSELDAVERIPYEFYYFSRNIEHVLHDRVGALELIGENLVIHSGYYDAYGSPHEQNIYRNSASNNTITVANSKGQNLNDFEAKGRLCYRRGFLAFEGVR